MPEQNPQRKQNPTAKLVEEGRTGGIYRADTCTYSVGGTTFTVAFGPNALARIGEATPVIVGGRPSSA